MKRIALNVLIGLTVCAIMLLALEGAARLLPTQFKSMATEKLAPEDRGLKVYQKNGFRGERPCTVCPPDNVRIVTMGGSSTYGIPMHYSSKTYSAYLQRMLDANLPDRHFEVLNGGIAGYGIWQIIDSLKKVVIPLKPDIVLICAWFNDSSNIPGWYRFADMSDREAESYVARLRWIEATWVYSMAKRSHLYAAARYLFLSPTQKQAKQKKKKHRPRSTPLEFREGLEQVVALSKQYSFRPVFVFEALNRTRARSGAVLRNKYYQAVEEVAQEHGITVIDTLTPLADREGEWLFYDFIHPNEHGHAVIAQAIFDELLPSLRSRKTPSGPLSEGS